MIFQKFANLTHRTPAASWLDCQQISPEGLGPREIASITWLHPFLSAACHRPLGQGSNSCKPYLFILGQSPDVMARLSYIPISPEPACNRAYLERPRDHSKTTDLSVTATWLLVFANRPLHGYCYAVDREQANLLRDAILRLVRLNPWIGEVLTVDRDRVANTANGHPGADSILRIETSDVASSYGILPDFLIADEFTHWQGDGSLWQSLISSAAERSNGLFASIANAGFVDSWQWKIREAIRTDSGWYFSRLGGPQASRMPAERLDVQRRMLPTVAFGRLWENEWSTGGGNALRQHDFEAAFTDAEPMSGNEHGYSFIAGVDLGLTRDCSAICVLGVRNVDAEGAGRIRLNLKSITNRIALGLLVWHGRLACIH